MTADRDTASPPLRLPDVARASIASMTRRVPRFRGLGTGYRMLNRALIRCGATPIAAARMKDGTTVRVDLRTHTEIDAFYRGEYDPRLLSLVTALLEPHECFVDVGANVGFYSVAVAQFLKRAGAGGRVVAFEPVAGNYRRLLENLRANDLAGVAHVYQLGLSNRAGRVAITLREDFVAGAETGNASIAINSEIDAGFATTQAELAPLDEFWPTVPCAARPIGFIKLDIEGHEDCALEGAQRTLATHRPVILMEVNKPYFRARGIDPGERFAGLLPAGYVGFRELQGAWGALRSFNECRELDNVFVVPAERLEDRRFAAFRA
jgi:FkbM family methyltransferase